MTIATEQDKPEISFRPLAGDLSPLFSLVFCSVIGLCVAVHPLKQYLESRSFGHRILAELTADSQEYSNVPADNLLYLPRIHRVTGGEWFRDPWNCAGPSKPLWAPFSLIPPLVGALFLGPIDSYFLAMGAWAWVQYSAIALLLCLLWTGPPWRFSRVAATVTAMVLVADLWIGARQFRLLPVSLASILQGLPLAATLELEAGLFTYGLYCAFLFAFWRLFAAPSRLLPWITGILAGLLIYTYYFHFAFAFVLLVAGFGLSLCLQRYAEAFKCGVAFLVGVVITIPHLLGQYMFVSRFSSIHFIERLDFWPGRFILADYRWLDRMFIPVVAVIIYLVFRKRDAVKCLLLRLWLIIAAAYVGVLSLRIVLGYALAPDHFWRFSLAIPAGIWIATAMMDLLRSRSVFQGFGMRSRRLVVLGLLVFLLGRSIWIVGTSSREVSPGNLSPGQEQLLGQLEMVELLSRPGMGFMTTDPALNCHAMCNLKLLPFVAAGCSPISPEEATDRYLAASYLLGAPTPAYPPFVSYTLNHNYYLYSLLFQPGPQFPMELEQSIRQRYITWEPDSTNWSSLLPAIRAVHVVYVAAEDFERAMERLKCVYTIGRTVPGRSGYAVSVTPLSNPVLPPIPDANSSE